MYPSHSPTGPATLAASLCLIGPARFAKCPSMPRPPSISPELMTTFVTVVRMDGDATKAADVLRINQPSMSKRLAFLQHAGRILRRPWLERVGKTWKLTDEGRRALPAVEELIRRYHLLTESIEE